MAASMRALSVPALLVAAALSAATSRTPGGTLPSVPHTQRTASGACVVAGGTAGYPFGRAPLVVHPHPRGVAAVWLPGLDATDCAAASTVGGAALASRLAADLAAAPTVAPGAYSCPVDDGTSVRVSFLFARRPDQTLHVSLSGCAWVTARGTVARAVTARLRRDLVAIAPAAWRAALQPAAAADAPRCPVPPLRCVATTGSTPT